MNTAELFSLKPVVSSRRRVLIVDSNVDVPHSLALLVELRYCLAARTRELRTVGTTRAALCFEVPEAARILRMSGARFYNRAHDEKLGPQSV